MPLPPAVSPTPRISKVAADEILDYIGVVVESIEDMFSSKSGALDPLSLHGNHEKPFLIALFPALVPASEIERSLSTRMGNLMQVAARAIAGQGGNLAEAQHKVSGSLAPGARDYINHLRRPGRAAEKDKANLANEISTLKALNTGAKVADEIEMDLFVSSGGKDYYFDLKTPSPNSEQPRDMKYRLMLARALRLPTDVDAFAVFYYNPRGILGPYTMGQAYLDYPGKEVLVGKAFWDFIGGPGTYEELIEVFKSARSIWGPQLENLLK